MISQYISMMLGVSAFVGVILLLMAVWAIKGGQFDDKDKMVNAPLLDDVDDLNELINKEEKQKREKGK
jgi:cbb3-type cytochrome oxidase maturation protein